MLISLYMSAIADVLNYASDRFKDLPAFKANKEETPQIKADDQN